MNIDRFHNQLAMSLGYDRLVKNDSVAIKVDFTNPDDPWISLESPEGFKYEFYASEEPEIVISRLKQIDTLCVDMLKRDIEEIVVTAHQAYINCLNYTFSTSLFLEHTAV